jgi:hypothetical protein
MRAWAGVLITCTFLGGLAIAAEEKQGATQGKGKDPTDWPREIKGEGGTIITVHQPQVYSWDGNKLKAQSAVAIKAGESQDPIYGVAMLEARTLIDKEAHVVTFDPIDVIEVKFPSAPDRNAALLGVLKKAVAGKIRSMDLERFEAALAVVREERKREQQPIKNEPPQIIISPELSILVFIDGDPAWRKVEGTELERVINTRPLVVRAASGMHYLHVFDGWLEAKALDGPWAISKSPPKELANVQKKAVESGQVDLLEGKTEPQKDQKKEDVPPPPKLKDGAPQIFVATKPTELIVTQGPPNFVPIQGTSLLFADNTTGNLFKSTLDQKTYVLVSGRWFRAPNEKGPWEFVQGDKLPEDFAKIPDDSPKENVKASVAGTPQAQEAVISNGIPQTAKVDRKQAKLTPPQFDGEPKLKAIEGTDLQYVANTSTPIIYVPNAGYYAVENAVWFVAKDLKGPWAVADSVPAAIYGIPTSSPLFYVTYVKVYEATPEVVYVGYTPGYYGTAVSYGTVVYGTGYYYAPWVGTAWYGPPVTYGFGATVAWTPWTGWGVGFGFGWSWGAATVTVGWGYGPRPWWGPAGWGAYAPYPGYRPPMGGVAYGPGGSRAAWGPGGWAGTTGNVYSRWGSTSAVSRTSGGYNAYTGNRWTAQTGRSYNSRTGTVSAGQRASVGNVYTGQYATGGRGVAQNPNTGTVAAGRGGTRGNAATGREVSAAQGVVANPRTGQATSVGAVSGERGTAVRAGDNVYAGRDGNVYRNSGNGWQQNQGGSWQNTRDAGQVQNLNRDQAARNTGAQRANGYRTASRGGGGGGRRR